MAWVFTGQFLRLQRRHRDPRRRGRSEVTLSFAATEMTGRPLVAAAGRFFAPANRYFPRMQAPVAPDELVAAVQKEIAAGARWVKVIGDIVSYHADPREDPSELARPAAVVIRGTRVR